MKSLKDFKTTPLEEQDKSDYTKFDMLVRAGLANKSQLNRLHRILDKMKEERPVFNPTERGLLQNMFNKMVDVITNNKMIFQQTRRVVREDSEELDERIIDTSDYKISASGRKVRAHRFKVGDMSYGKEDDDVKNEDVIDAQDGQIDEQTPDLPKDPPFVLILKRKAIRLYPNKTKIALYHNAKLNKYFSIPYGPNVNSSPLQAEEVDDRETVIEQLQHIAESGRTAHVKFSDGQTEVVIPSTATAITEVYQSVNEENQIRMNEMLDRSPDNFLKLAAFALSKTKK
jgi:hypothetical protein